MEQQTTTPKTFTGSIFDEPYYENLSYEYIDFIYYYLLQKLYNHLLNQIHEQLQPLQLENPAITKMYKKRYYSFVPTDIINVNTQEQTVEQWESVFKTINIELLYFVDIHRSYYTDFENDEYPDHPTHPSNPIYLKRLLYQPDPNGKKEYTQKIKNRIIMDIYKMLSLDFEEDQEKALELPSHIYSIFKRLPPNHFPFLNYVRNKKTNSFYLESMTILNVQNWLS
jgi:hypothetical protein